MVNIVNGNILDAVEDVIIHQEVWKDIKGYEGLYQISNLGRVKSIPRNGTIKTERIINYSLDKYGYPQIVLNNKKHRCFRIHRLVAETFIPNPENKDTVNHKDGNKENNNVNNLEWNTIQENNRHAFNIGLQRQKEKAVKQYTLENKYIKTWKSGRQAERILNINHTNIRKCCIGIYNQCNGYKWRYAND